MAGRLAGKVAMVTCAAPQSPGIGNGSATAILFAREGATVILVNRSLRHAQILQRTIEQEGGTCAVSAADVSQAADVQRLVETVVQQYGKLDILVNNVGIFVPGTLETITEETWDSAMQVNVKGTMLCCKYSIPHMKARGGGAIINISTIAAVVGMQGYGGMAAYAASKAGLHGLTRAMAADYAADGIRVNGIIVGTGWDVGWAAVYLASEEARWVTGAFLPVDGGQLAVTKM
jgi:NAD(P)-dependent dehydrogenase (short-subunit alcohol dehydrogenase family)